MTTSFLISLFEILIDEDDASTTSLRNHSYLLNRDLLLDSIVLLIFIARESYESKNYEEIIADNNSNSEEWENAIENEINFLIKNKTWKLVDCLKDRKLLKDKWVFILKRGLKGEITRYKARWVILKCSQREELDYNEIFVLVVKLISYKALFVLAAILNWNLKQINLKIAFLYNAVKELIYMYQLTSFKSQKYSNKIYKLNKILYDLKQLSRVWYNIFVEFMKE